MILVDDNRQVEQREPDELVRALFDFADIKAEPQSLYYQDGDTLKYRFHKYQKKAMAAKERFILLLGGTQSGKTSFGPIWLHREICLRGAGDYIAVAPTYPLMQKKMLPEFLRLFQDTLKLGEYRKTDKVFIVSEQGEIALFGKPQEVETKIHFAHAQDPDSLESATAKGSWLDECGQKKFRLDSFEAIMRRQSLYMGRVLMTTTPYYLGWLKTKFWDVWERGDGQKESVRVIRFPSIANPAFPIAEYERARASLPLWKFNMFYNALFTRPAGLIYDAFSIDKHVVRRFAIPDNWERFLGLDFGAVNTVGTFWAKDPNADRYYCYRQYKGSGRTAAEHKAALLKDEPFSPLAFGGAKSENQWRDEFGATGLPVNLPEVSEVEIGINRVYGGFKKNQLFIFDDIIDLLDELGSYSRELDDEGQPTEKIENKSIYHFLDSLRYIGSHFLDSVELFGGSY